MLNFTFTHAWNACMHSMRSYTFFLTNASLILKNVRGSRKEVLYNNINLKNFQGFSVSRGFRKAE